jgi:hypothetical protein
LPSGALTDRHFAQDGWYFVIGALCNPQDDHRDVISCSRHV